MEKRNLNQTLCRNASPEYLDAETLRWKGDWLTVSSGIVKIQEEMLKDESREEEKNEC